MADGITLFVVRGIPVRAHPSWLLILALLTWNLAVGYFPHVLPELPVGALWIRALVAALLLFASVFLHELAHSIAALHYGIPVSSITLHIFGGVSQLEREPSRPGSEFAIAVVGPLTSFAIAGVLVVAGLVLDPGAGARATMEYLIFVNVLLGVFNLIPGFPLDGGRVLRAVLWRLKGNLAWATRVAARTGSVFAFILIGLGILRAFTGELIGGLWFVLIGLFLRQSAESSYQQMVLRGGLSPYVVRDAMTRDVKVVPADTPVGAVVDNFFWKHHVSSFPVVDGQRVVGILGLDQVKALAPEARSTTRARDLMLPLSDALRVTPADSLWHALEKLTRNGLGRVAVIDGDTLVGYLSVKDVVHVLSVARDQRATTRRQSGERQPS
jgi:Zn-dependent protease/predicted transcriptional regulator